ncbi:SPFH domain-containing protein [Vogesella sp. LIG4]|uniref:SPFH domain-containing protein n=1 Tax=Vogesella sp. LIG4 TaxID=1192162 RepID=UPI0018D46347|nr:SPFH domain-containing protein [Vogesella sp. LIG4]
MFSFISKQFIDILEWQEDSDGVLAWRYPMQDNEIQYGASLTVRESQMAVFINEGRIADVFGPGMYKLTTQTLPVLTYLQHWDKLFASPFKSDVIFFSTRLQLGRKWGTPQAITLRDKDFGMVRLRAFGIYSYRVTDPQRFFTEVSGTRDSYSVDELEQQLRDQVVATIASTLGNSAVPFLDMAANQGLMADTIKTALLPAFARYGIELDSFALENISLPEELQKAIDKRIAMGMAGDLAQYTRYQAAESIPLAAQNEGGLAGLGAALSTGVGVGQVMGQALQQSLSPAATTAAPTAAGGDTPQAKLAQLKGLLDAGLITQADYDAAKADVLKKLVG